MFARFYILEKNGFLLLIFLCMARTMGAEPEEENVSPLPGIHLSIFLMVLLFRTFGTSKSLGRWWALVVPLFRAEGFALGPLGRSKSLCVCLALVVAFGAKGFFWFGPFSRSKPLGVCLALLVVFGAEGFLVLTF